MKVGIHLGGLGGGHEVRGIGVHTKELFKRLKVEEYNPEKKYDLVHYTVFKPFTFSLPFRKPAKKVVLTIHDLIPHIYPKHYPGGIKGNLIFLIQKCLIKRNVDAIITISETSKKDICRFLVVAEKYRLPKTFALYVGDVNYNKNIPGLIEMCKHSNIPLVIVGKQAKEIRDGDRDLSHPELKHLEKVDWGKTITLGFIDDDDLAAIYNLADVYIQPSFYEGFSLPPLEAKTCGTWVIATRIQAHVEILESGREYSWEKTARETLGVYEKI